MPTPRGSAHRRAPRSIVSSITLIGEDERPVGQHGLLDVVGHQLDPRAVLGAQLGHQRLHPQPGEGVEGGEGLVQEEQPRLADQRPSQGHPLGLTSRQGARPGVGVVGQSHIDFVKKHGSPGVAAPTGPARRTLEESASVRVGQASPCARSSSNDGSCLRPYQRSGGWSPDRHPQPPAGADRETPMDTTFEASPSIASTGQDFAELSRQVRDDGLLGRRTRLLLGQDRRVARRARRSGRRRGAAR